MGTDNDSASLPMDARLEQAGLIWEEAVGAYQLTEGARRLLGSWDRLGGRDPLEVLLEGGSYAELLLAMAKACTTDGLAWESDARTTLVRSVAFFADHGWAEQAGTEGRVPPEIIDRWEEHRRYLLDELHPRPRPSRLIGRLLHDEAELVAMLELHDAVASLVADAASHAIAAGDVERIRRLDEREPLTKTAWRTLGVLGHHQPDFPYSIPYRRELRPDERELLRWLIAQDDSLTADADRLKVVARCGCGECRTILLGESLGDEPIRGHYSAGYQGRAADGRLVEVGLFVSADGRIAELDVYSYDGDEAGDLPPPSALEPI